VTIPASLLASALLLADRAGRIYRLSPPHVKENHVRQEENFFNLLRRMVSGSSLLQKRQRVMPGAVVPDFKVEEFAIG
jgi:hypothetical protein